MLQAAAGKPEEADYLALSQGQYGTELRHKAVVRAMPANPGRVLDLGCGTGLLLERICHERGKPTYYHGVDGLHERKAAFMARATQFGVCSRFTVKPMQQPFWNRRYVAYYDVVLLVGVMGFYGLHTHQHIGAMVHHMQHAGTHGVVTFPICYGHIVGGDENYMRWPLEDLQSHPKLIGKHCQILDREGVFSW
jgi:SAM-dependent methyltransferase